MSDDPEPNGPQKRRPAIAIITPTKNRLPLLLETIASVCAQTLTEWEHVVIDDRSDDDTLKEVASLAEADPRIRLLSREGDKSGANVCRNQGVRAARADLIVFLDSDDLLAPHALARRVEMMDRNQDCDFITFQNSVFVRECGDLKRDCETDLLGDDLLSFLYFELPWIITAPTWRRSTLIDLGLFDEALPSWQDVELHIRALTNGCRYLRFPQVDNHVRWQFEETKISVEQRRSPRHLAAAGGIVKTFEGLVRQGPGMNWVRQRALCSLYFFIAERWVDAGRPATALEVWSEVRRRRLGSLGLHLSGAGLLALRTFWRAAGERVGHKWKGWSRLRTNPELVTTGEKKEQT